MKVLITGGYGFIGNHLARKLITGTRRHDVFIVDDLSRGKQEFLGDISRPFSFSRINILHSKKLATAFQKFRPDAVIHLAARHFIPECNKYPAKTLRVNVAGTRTIVELSNAHNVRRLIVASSASVYGSHASPCTERTRPHPRDVYGKSKLRAESVVLTHARVPWSIMRLFNIIGENETHPHLIPAILSGLKRSSSITLGNTASRRDYLYVKDLVDGIVTLLHTGKGDSQIINFGSGIGTTAAQIVEMIEKITGNPLTVISDPRLLRRIDPPTLIASNKKAHRLLGWHPKYSLEKTLRSILHAQR